MAKVTQDLNRTCNTHSSLLASIDEMAFRYAELAIDLRSSSEETLSDGKSMYIRLSCSYYPEFVLTSFTCICIG